MLNKYGQLLLVLSDELSASRNQTITVNCDYDCVFVARVSQFSLPLAADLLYFDSAVTSRLIVHVTSTFEQQVRVAGTMKHLHDGIPPRSCAIEKYSYDQQRMAPGFQNKPIYMSDDYLLSWYGRVLESIKTRYRKLQRFGRCVQYIVHLDKALTLCEEAHSVTDSVMLQNTRWPMSQ